MFNVFVALQNIQSFVAKIINAVSLLFEAKVLEERCTDRDTSYDSPMKFEVGTIWAVWFVAE